MCDILQLYQHLLKAAGTRLKCLPGHPPVSYFKPMWPIYHSGLNLHKCDVCKNLDPNGLTRSGSKESCCAGAATNHSVELNTSTGTSSFTLEKRCTNAHSATIQPLKLLVFEKRSQPTVEKRTTVVHNATSLPVMLQL